MANAKRITVGLAQINNSFSNQNYLPYSVGLLEAYVRERAPDPDRYEFLLPLYKRVRVAEAVAHLGCADVVGFSAYVWNIRLSLEIARRLKERRPETTIVFGGPQVPDRPDAFLTENPFIDVVVHNEGERTFLDLLESHASPERRAELDGISFRAGDGSVVRQPPRERIKDLGEIPSPFLTGVLDRLMAAVPEENWIGLWETNRGCPFRCTFCDWGSATAAKVNQFDMERLRQEVAWFADHRVEFIFCCDANFGILPRDVDIARHVAETKEQRGYPRALSVQNTKNATERAYATQKILSDAALNKGVALSMQSVDDATLEAIQRRNISLDSYLELQRRFTRDGVETYSDLILGLPGETYESFAEGVSRLIESGQHNRIQFNNLSILPNAEMGDPEYQRRHGMVTVESRIINIHGALEESEDGIEETQQLVIATAAMPREDWRRSRTFGWMTALLHFDKLLQIPFIVANETAGLRYRALIEAFLDVDRDRHPLLGEIRDFLLDFARSIQEGGPEYVYSAEWLGIFGPADEYVFLKLTADGRLDAFYDEARELLHEQIAATAREADVALDHSSEALDEALRLSRALLKQPFQSGELVVLSHYDLLPYYRNALRGLPRSLDRSPVRYRIDRSSERWEDFQTWSREVVWYGNKKGAYLYGNRAVQAELAGHY
jgi:radical SAM superfamily enzyme YgiQ (UPF0313 family)